MKSPRLDEPFHYCPSYRVCSCNSCPLDPDYHDHRALPLDPEQKCRSNMPTRLRLVQELAAEGNPFIERLPFGGLTLKEERRRLRKAAFAALPEEEKLRRSVILRRMADTAPSMSHNQGLQDHGGKPKGIGRFSGSRRHASG